MVLNISEFKKYLLLIWIIIASGVWSINVPPSFTVFLNFSLAACMLYALVKKRYLKSILPFLLMITLLACSLLSNFDFSSWMTYAFIICFCIIGMYIGLFWRRGEFLEKYTNLIFVIALVSLIMYFFRDFLGNHQAGFPIVKGQSVSYTNFYVYLYCRELPDRNCAIFWEPGAFAVFIGIAIYTLLVNETNNKYLKIIILVITLFTTQSTLAYTIILFTVIFFLLYKNRTLNTYQRFLIGCISIIIVLLIMNELDIFKNIEEKLFTGLNTNASSKARNVAQFIDMQIIYMSPLIGVGFSNYLNHVQTIGAIFGQNWTMAANTFTFMGAIFGVPYVIVTVLGITKLCPCSSSKLFKLASSCFWIWLFITQNFSQKPLFYCLIFLGYTYGAFKKMEVENNE